MSNEIINCTSFIQAHKLFDAEYAKQREGKSKWSYFDVTIGGMLMKSSMR